MEDKKLKYKTIEAYLSGKLAGEELIAFEAQLNSDPSLVEELMLHREIQEHLSDKAYLALEQKIKTIAAKHKGKKQNKVHSLPLRKIAIALILLLGITMLYKFYNKPDQSAPALFAQHYSVPELLTINRDLNVKLDLTKAYRAYEAKDFTTAYQAFQAQAQKGDLAIADQFYWAISALSKKSSNTEEAIKQLEKIIKHDNNAYLDPAKWYLALAYLQNEKTTRCKTLLQELVNANSPKYQKQAAELLQKL